MSESEKNWRRPLFSTLVFLWVFGKPA